MPNRIIKESICTSDQIDKLSAFAEVTFYRLIVNADDYGRMDGRAAVLRSRLFPLKDVRNSQIEDALRELASVELVNTYYVDGKPFVRLSGWDRHQQIRAKKSKYPAPEEICNQMISDDCKCPRNPIQSESNPNPNTNPNPNARETRGMEFEKFWSAYPRKEGKQKARSAFEKVTVSLDVLLIALESQKKSSQWTKDNGQFIPHAATWLNGKRWEDQLAVDRSGYVNGRRQLDDDEIAAIRRQMAEF